MYGFTDNKIIFYPKTTVFKDEITRFIFFSGNNIIVKFRKCYSSLNTCSNGTAKLANQICVSMAKLSKGFK